MFSGFSILLIRSHFSVHWAIFSFTSYFDVSNFITRCTWWLFLIKVTEYFRFSENTFFSFPQSAFQRPQCLLIKQREYLALQFLRKAPLWSRPICQHGGLWALSFIWSWNWCHFPVYRSLEIGSTPLWPLVQELQQPVRLQWCAGKEKEIKKINCCNV